MQLARSPWGRLLAALCLLISGTGTAEAAPKATDAQLVALMEQHGYVAIRLVRASGTGNNGIPALELPHGGSTLRPLALLDTLATQSLVRAKAARKLGLAKEGSAELVQLPNLKTKEHSFGEVTLKRADWPQVVETRRPGRGSAQQAADATWFAPGPSGAISSGLSADFVLGSDFLKSQRALLDHWGDRLFVPRADHRPAQKAALLAALIQGGYIPVSSQPMPGNGMLLPFRSRDLSGSLLLGTACVETVLHREAARRKAKDTGQDDNFFVQLSAPNEKGRRMRLFNLELGPWLGSTYTVGSLDLSGWSLGDETQAGTPAIGILGVDFLIDSTALVDFGGGQLYIPKEPRQKR